MQETAQTFKTYTIHQNLVDHWRNLTLNDDGDLTLTLRQVIKMLFNEHSEFIIRHSKSDQ
jgi:hypothetical protein